MAPSFNDRGARALRLVPRDESLGPPDKQPALDDASLVAALKEGDVRIASVLCDRVWPQVDRTIRRLLGRQDSDRDDMAQLALIELVGSIGRYRGDCSLDSWAQTITAHVVFKHIRRRQIERRIFTDLLAEDGPASTSHAEARSLSHNLLARVAEHLDGMKPDRAWAFVMHDVLGYDLREISTMTNSSVAATQSRLVRGRRELHQRIAGDSELAAVLTGTEKLP